MEDVWQWRLDDGGRFTVNSMYKKLEGLLLEERSVTEDQGRVFGNIWKSLAPSKVVAFSWKLLLDRIPTKVNLSYRSVLPPEASLNCVLCNGNLEVTNHLFIHCEFAQGVWAGLFSWLGISFLSPPNLFIHWECWNGSATNKKVRNGYRLIWHVAVWRNDGIFNNSISTVEELVEAIKVVLWRWILTRVKVPACLFYEWCWNPRECLLR